MWCSLGKNWGCETFLHIGVGYFFRAAPPPRGEGVRKNGDTTNFLPPPPAVSARPNGRDATMGNLSPGGRLSPRGDTSDRGRCPSKGLCPRGGPSFAREPATELVPALALHGWCLGTSEWGTPVLPCGKGINRGPLIMPLLAYGGLGCVVGRCCRQNTPVAFAWSQTTTHSHTQPHRATHSHTRPHTATQSQTWAHTPTQTATLGDTQAGAATHGNTQPHIGTGPHNNTITHTTTHSHTRAHTATCSNTDNHTQPHTGTHG